jgi:transcriptional regulator with XRE-family HTH domain
MCKTHENHRYLGLAMRRAREAAGLTLADMGRELGLNPSSVGDYERGVTAPCPCTLIAYCNACDSTEPMDAIVRRLDVNADTWHLRPQRQPDDPDQTDLQLAQLMLHEAIGQTTSAIVQAQAADSPGGQRVTAIEARDMLPAFRRARRQLDEQIAELEAASDRSRSAR